jgi:hypothetical protein
MTRKFKARVASLHDAIDELMQLVSSVVHRRVSGWMLFNRLQLKIDKTDVIWRSAGRRMRQFHLPVVHQYRCRPLQSTKLALFVASVGVYIDSDL